MSVYDYVLKARSEGKAEEKKFDIKYYEVGCFPISQTRIDMLRQVYFYLSSATYRTSMDRFISDENTEVYLQALSKGKDGASCCLIGVKNYDTPQRKKMTVKEFKDLCSENYILSNQEYAVMDFKARDKQYPIIYFNDGNIYLDIETSVLINTLGDDEFGMALARECLKWEDEKNEFYLKLTR